MDIGPGAGKYGGEVTGKGTLEEIKRQDSSVTGMYLNEKSPRRKDFRKGTGAFIDVKNANLYNLKNIDVRFPVGCMTSVTGVSGSGKSTLVFDVLAKAGTENGSGFNRVEGTQVFDRIVTVEQSPLVQPSIELH